MKVESARKRADQLNRMAALDEENAQLRLAQAEHRAEVAKLKTELIAMRMAKEDLEERLKWVTLLAGSGYRPRDLPDSKGR
jgi:predicted  nucleic acid-binding Zn-ribbon protein